MKNYDLMLSRHAVRSYLDKPIEDEKITEIEKEIAACNKESGLHIQLVKNEPNAFDGFMAHYGKFKGVKNYIALIGKKHQDEAIGYYGERIVLLLQTLGLNSCWVAMTYKKVKNAFCVEKGEKLYCVIATGYGETEGVAHTIKPITAVSKSEGAPEWFLDGVRGALLAPTAMNQQKFFFTLDGDKVNAKAGKAMYAKLDLGIAKYHFELASGKDHSVWKN